MLLAGCGGDTGGGSGDGGSGGSGGAGQAPERPEGSSEAAENSVDLSRIGFLGDASTDKEPASGGTLSYGVFSEIGSLDPAKASGTGSVGGTELAALYDVLMRYDAATGEFHPQLAKSLTSSDDSATWELRLRPEVTFSDGTSMDAAAVIFSIEHYIENKGRLARLADDIIDTMTATDEYTVTFSLTSPWPNFAYLLSTPVGNVVSPAAVQKYGDDFGDHPVGAGPFVLDHFSPGEELVLTTRQDYWGGEPHLDKVRLVPIVSGQTRLDTLTSGGLDAVYLRVPKLVSEAIKSGLSGFLNIQNLGTIELINNGVGGASVPGADARIRKAISYAIDPELVTERATAGVGLPGKLMFQEFSRWHTDADALSYQPEKAKELLAEVKQETGYDGSLTYSCYQSPSLERRALAVESLLEAVGFDVAVTINTTVANHIKKVFVSGDYDLACWAFSVWEAAPYVGLATNLLSTAPQNVSGYGFQSAEMDHLLHELQVAAGDEKPGIIAEIQQLWTEVVPAVVESAAPQLVAWDDDVHGVQPTVTNVLLLDDAWVESS